MKSMKRQKLVSEWIRHVLLTAFVIVYLIPFLYALYESFLSKADINKWVWPHRFVLENYVYVFEAGLPIWYRNTLIMTVGIILGNVVTNTLAGYALAKIRFPGSRLVFFLIIGTMMIPGQITLVPIYSMCVKLGWINTYRGLIIPFMTSGMLTFFMRQFFLSIPNEIEEAARIDGMKEFQIYSRIIAPLAKPAFVTLGIYHFMNNWNDLLYPMMLTSSVDMRTLSAGLAILVGSNSIKFGPTLAATVISVAPLLILFLFGQKFFMEGIATSGMKE